MTVQLAIRFDDPRSNGTATSNAAATSMRPHAARLREFVFAAIDRAGVNGLTCDECEAALKMSHQTVSARFNELARLGKIFPIGQRKTRSGRNAVIWSVK